MSVIIPVHNGEATLNACLAALSASSRRPDEVIVADDSSTDASARIAAERDLRLLALPGGPHGPAFARNRAAEAAMGDVLVFLDADVAVHADALALMESYLTQHPTVAALFGSYDADPPARGLVTRYKNLLHHYVHQHGRREAETFWAGCAAMRRSVFESSGGFSESYGKPSIEDIELGGRLHRAGHSLWLCPDVQGTHLKRWTFLSWLRTDIFARAVPWTQLILQNASLPNALNLDWKSRVSALCAWGAVLFLILGVFLPWTGLGLLACLGGLAVINADLLRFFRERGGAGFAAGAFGLHLLYLLYSSLTYAVIAVPAKLARHGLLLLLLATLMKGLAWSVLVPPWQAYDEPQHFLYGQSVERMATLHVPPNLQLPQELWDSARLAQLDVVRFHPERPIDLSDRKRIAAALSDTGQLSVKRSYLSDPKRKVLTQANFYRYHPPLYYILLAAVQKPLEDQNIAFRLLACRWLSVLIGLALVGLTCAAGYTLWPDQPHRILLLGTLVSFQPMVSFTTSTVTNSALEMLAFSAVLCVSIRVLRKGLTVSRAFALGMVTGLGLLTKMSFFSVLPLLGLLFLWDMARSGRSSRLGGHTSWLWAGITLLPFILSGWWYRSTVQSGGDSLVSSYGRIVGHSHVSLLSYVTTFSWASVYCRVMASYWGAFGSVGDTHLPRSLQFLLIVLTGLAGLGVMRFLTQRLRAHDPASMEKRFPVFFLGFATLCIVLFYVGIDYRIAQKLGGHFGLRGQYYLPPIIGQMTWLMLGLELLIPERLRRGAFWLLGTGMIGLNFYALLDILLPRYYGAGPLLEQLSLPAVLQPVSSFTAFAFCSLFFAFSLLLMAALGGRLFLGITQKYGVGT